MFASLNTIRTVARRQNFAKFVIRRVTQSSSIDVTGRIHSSPWLSPVFKQTLPLISDRCRCYSMYSSRNLPYDELKSRVQDRSLQLFDVREPNECEAGMIPGAINIPLGEIGPSLAMEPADFQARYKATKPEKTDTNVVFYCRGGNRSASALEAAIAAGYQNCRHFPGGWLGWEEKQ